MTEHLTYQYCLFSLVTNELTFDRDLPFFPIGSVVTVAVADEVRVAILFQVRHLPKNKCRTRMSTTYITVNEFYITSSQQH
jgi:hypothetical protein